MKKLFLLFTLLCSTIIYGQGCTELVVTITDEYGDGWNGNYLEVAGQSITLETGDYGTDTICVDLNQCNILIVDGGSWQSEIGWSIEGLLDGGAPYNGTLGNCEDIDGCTDSLALNYDSEALVEDYSCEYPSCSGVGEVWAEQTCADDQAIIYWHWDSDVNPSCTVVKTYYGNTQVGPFIYDVNINNGIWGVYAGNGQMPPNWSEEHYFYVELADGSFSDVVYFTPEPCIIGCTNEESGNYNPWATIDSGECSNTECSDGESHITLELTLDQYPSETGWILTDISNGSYIEDVPAGSYTFNQSNTTITYDLCVPEMGVELILSDLYGDGIAGSLWGGTDGNFVILGDALPCGGVDTLWSLPEADFGNTAWSGVIQLPSCEIPPIIGCMDINYVEFNPLAEQGNPEGCITLKTYGCTDPLAFNYNSEVNTNEIISVCDYTLTLEDDAADGWGNSYLGVSQGNQSWTFTIGPGIDTQSWNLMLQTDKPVYVYYFEVVGSQQTQAGVEFQTLHNSFTLVNSDGNTLLDGGTNPFEDNGAGALQSYESPFWTSYSAIPYCGDYCIEIVLGCTNELAFNYNNLANTDDGSCIEVILGCTNELAFNYNELANIDNGNCEPIIYGCMDDVAWNYNFLANIEDNSCLYFGCTDIEALNYDENANVDNGACIYPVLGCTDSDAFNFNVDANVNDGNCIPFVYGCMDPTMWNYDATANIPSDNCIPFIFGCTDTIAFNFDPLTNTDNGTCIPVTFGCTDPVAFNYNPGANTEDFSCIAVVIGCTDPTAFNYNPLANTNNNCMPVILGCTDTSGDNYDPLANTDDGSCLYDAGCIGDPGDPYWLNDTCYAWVITIDPYCCEKEWDDMCQSQYWYCQYDSPLGIDDLLEDNSIIIYPNPSTTILNIVSDVDISIQVYDVIGNLVIMIKPAQLRARVNQLDISHLAPGIYNFIIMYDGKSINKKVVKQ